MGYEETDCNLCKACYVKLKKPSKKAAKKMVLTTYKDFCDNCNRLERLVEYTWDNDIESEGELE